MTKVLVGLSGGVDSAVSAYLLQKQGYTVVGGFMKNYVSPSGPCSTREDAESAIEVANFLGIELKVFDFQDEYYEQIIEYIFQGYQQGITPNPDILCNNLIKFKLFLDAALELGFDKIATGHYARVEGEMVHNPPLSPLAGGNSSSGKKRVKERQLDLTKEDIKKRGLVWDGEHFPYNPINLEKAKFLRKNMTKTEKKLWNIFLKNHKYKFYRQRPIDHFIVDFYCRKASLVIEVDGGIHNKKYHLEYDNMRTDFLNLYGLEVIRFTNKEIENDFDAVCKKIDFHIDQNLHKYISKNSKNPLLQGEVANEESRRGLVKQKGENNFFKLLRGVDRNKDQSYFLSGLDQFQLSKALFPLGELTKPEVRDIAQQIGLPNADRKDSQGLCFIGNIPIKKFLTQKLPIKEGNIIDEDGNILGKHDGAWFFTIGQNRGLKLPYKAFVYKIDVEKNIVFVSKNKESANLVAKEIHLKNRHRIGKKYDLPLEVTAKIRYRQEPQPATLITKGKIEEGEISIVFDEEQRAIAPGQSVVAYVGEECIGGGIIV